MDRVALMVFVLLLATVLAEEKRKGGFYSFNVSDVNNEPFPLETYRGKISLVVNVASECGYTDEHYKQLSAIYKELAVEKGEPFTVLAFPCNQFGSQEPYDIEVILDFARNNYAAKFPIFGKINVIGNDADPVYEYIQRNHGTEPQWNFWKYLIDENGAVIGGWSSRVSVNDMRPDIDKAIKNLKERQHNEL